MAEPLAATLQKIATSPHLGQSLDRAHRLALDQKQGVVTLEHLLFALTEDADAGAMLATGQVNLDALRGDISGYLGRLPEQAPVGDDGTARPNPDFLRILKAAAAAARQSPRKQIDGAIVLAAIIGDANTPAAGLLKSHGLTFEVAIKALQRANVEAKAKATVPPPAPERPETSPPETAAADPSASAARAPKPAKAASSTPSTEELLASVRARIEESKPTRPAAKIAMVKRAAAARPAPPQPEAPAVAEPPMPEPAAPQKLNGIAPQPAPETAAPPRPVPEPVGADADEPEFRIDPRADDPGHDNHAHAPQQPGTPDDTSGSSLDDLIEARPPVVQPVMQPVAPPVVQPTPTTPASANTPARAPEPMPSRGPPPLPTPPAQPAASSPFSAGPPLRTPEQLFAPQPQPPAPTPPPLPPPTLNRPPLPFPASPQRSETWPPPPAPPPVVAVPPPFDTHSPALAPPAFPRPDDRVLARRDLMRPPVQEALAPLELNLNKYADRIPKSLPLMLPGVSPAVVRLSIPRAELPNFGWPMAVSLRLTARTPDIAVAALTPDTHWISTGPVPNGGETLNWSWSIAALEPGASGLSLALFRTIPDDNGRWLAAAPLEHKFAITVTGERKTESGWGRALALMGLGLVAGAAAGAAAAMYLPQLRAVMGL
jgi:hypothetical protein